MYEHMTFADLCAELQRECAELGDNLYASYLHNRNMKLPRERLILFFGQRQVEEFEQRYREENK